MGPTVIRSISLVATAICLGLGLLGMLAGFMYLSMSSPQDIAAGQAGFVAGAVLATGAVISLAVVAAGTKSP